MGRVTPKEMAQAADEGDEAVRQAIAHAGGYLGIGVSNFVESLSV